MKYGYLYPSFTPEFGPSRPILSQEEKDRNAALFIAQRKAEAAAANAPRPVQSNPLPTTNIPPNSQVVPRPPNSDESSGSGILDIFKGRAPHYASPSIEAPSFEPEVPEVPEIRERFIPAPIRDSIPLPGTNQILPGLGGNPNGALNPEMGPGVLTPDQFEGGSQSDGKRNKTSFADYLMSKQNVGPGQQTLGSKLVRMGAAMQAGNMRGGLSGGMAAMGQEYGNIQNEGIANDLAMAAAQAEARNQDDNGLRDAANLEMLFQNALTKFDQYSSVTGAIDNWFTSNWDKSGIPGGNAAREAFRIELRDIIVKSTLLNTANTKGAISDKEMMLFQSSVPSMNMDEEVWKKWLQARIENLREVQNRLNNGIIVGRGAEVSLTNRYVADGNTSNNKATPQQQPMTPIPSAFTDEERAAYLD